MVEVQQLQRLFKSISSSIRERREELCALDGVAGDGDHGISIDLGWAAVCCVPAEEYSDVGEYLKDCARTFIQTVGASIGPLYGTAFLRAAKYALGKSQLTATDCIEMIAHGVRGMQERGNAKRGDKTLLDTLLPFMEVMCDPKEVAWESRIIKAMHAAHDGMEATREMVANIGRSSRLGERSLGGLDPGAASAYVVLRAGVVSFLPNADIPIVSFEPKDEEHFVECEKHSQETSTTRVDHIHMFVDDIDQMYQFLSSMASAELVTRFFDGTKEILRLSISGVDIILSPANENRPRGIHHIGMKTSDYESASCALQRNGWSEIFQSLSPNSSVQFFESRDGIVIELMHEEQRRFSR